MKIISRFARSLKYKSTWLLFFSLLLSACSAPPAYDSEILKRETITDWHVHVAGLGYGDSGNFINQQMRDNFRFSYFLKWMNVTEEELQQHGDQLVVERLHARIAQSRYIDQAVILALDGVIDRDSGKLDRERTQFYVDNDFVAEQTARYPRFLFGASINPERHDSLQLLEQVHAQGAVLIKWLPSIMHFDPADKRFEPFYKKMAELGLILLSHTGMEKSFPEANDALCDPRRLELALQSGVMVIAAHLATTGKSEGEDNFSRMLPMFDEYPNLYADISSLTQINKLGYLVRALKETELSERLLYGTDWPLQYFPLVSPWYQLPHIGFSNAWRISGIDNEWDRDVELKKAMGVPAAVFSRKLGRVQ